MLASTNTRSKMGKVIWSGLRGGVGSPPFHPSPPGLLRRTMTALSVANGSHLPRCSMQGRLSHGPDRSPCYRLDAGPHVRLQAWQWVAVLAGRMCHAPPTCGDLWNLWGLPADTHKMPSFHLSARTCGVCGSIGVFAQETGETEKLRRFTE